MITTLPLRRNILKAFSAAICLLAVAGCWQDSAPRQEAFETLARWEDRRFAPEDSLLAMIKSGDAHIRLRAVRSAGLIGQHTVVPAMIETLGDRSETVAAQAAFSLGLLGDVQAVPALESMLHGPEPRKQLAAAQGLAHLPHQGRGLMTAISSQDDELAATAWDGLRNVADQADSADLTTAIIDGLSQPKANVLWRVLRCAERRISAPLLPHLAPHVRSLHPQVRVHAYRALSHYDQGLALKAVLDGLQNEDHRPTRPADRTLIAAARALGTLAHHGYQTDGLLTELEKNNLTENFIEMAGSANVPLAATALQAMERLADPLDLPPEAARQESLLPVWRIRLARAAHSHLDHGEKTVQAAAVGAWAALRGSGCSGELTSRLEQSNDDQMTAALLRALARHGSRPLESLLAHVGDSSSARIRVAALEGLHHWAQRQAAGQAEDRIFDSLTQGAAADDFVVAATAINLLGNYRQRLTLVALAEAWDTTYNEGGAEVRRAILAALEELGPEVKDLARGRDDDPLLISQALLLREGFDSGNLHIRLESRQAALETGLLPDNLIPSEESLRATMPAFQRNPAQPGIRVPFDAPRVRCDTHQGSFWIQLDGNLAPNTCAMFLDLIERGFYQNLVFHRVVPDFVVQGGDPRGDGWGGPGYTIRSEWSAEPYRRSVVGIAHDGKDTGGSQFFVTLSEQPHLNGRYTVFGQVVEGMEVVDLVQAGESFELFVEP